MKCKACSSKERVIKHHIRYKKYGAREDKTVSLCEDCHNMLHRFIKGSDPDLENFTRQFIKAGRFWK